MIKKKTIVQICIVPFLFIFIVLFHEFGHALMWYLNGVRNFSLELVFPIRLTLHFSYDGILPSQIISSLMGSIFGGSSSLIGILISKKYKLHLFQVSFYILLLSDTLNLVLPLGLDLQNIIRESVMISSIIQIICACIFVIVSIYLIRTMYQVIDDHYMQKAMSKEMVKFYEQYDKIMEQYNDSL